MFDEAFFVRGIDRRNTLAEKWDDRTVMNEGGIPLWVADMDFPCAPAIMEAVQARAKHACFGYSADDPSGDEALIGFWKRRHGLAIAPDEILMLPCVVTGLKAGVRAFTKPGDGVAIFTPVYGPFHASIRLNGRRIIPVPLLRDETTGRYGMNLAGMEDALKGGAKLILFCSPHNPVSRLWTKDELTALCRLAERYDVPMICDEIHADFVFKPGVFTSVLSIPEAADRTVMLCSASKTFNIAGLLQAAAICKNEKMRAALQADMTAAGTMCGNIFAMAAAKAAYTACDEWLDGLVEYLDGSRTLIKQLTEQYLPRAVMTPVEATFLAWLDMRAYGKTCAQIAEKCKAGGVALTGGTFFGEEGEGFMRVNFGCPRALLTEGMRRLGRIMEEE